MAMKNSLFLFMLIASSLPHTAVGISSFSDFHWQSRIVITQINDSQSIGPIEEEINQYQSAIADRKLVVIVVNSDKLWIFPSTSVNQTSLHQTAVSRLKSANTVLIGLDGGTKGVYETLDWQAIFNDIDGMPMRRAELERNRRH